VIEPNEDINDFLVGDSVSLDDVSPKVVSKKATPKLNLENLSSLDKSIGIDKKNSKPSKTP
jgi:hypothetical protein